MEPGALARVVNVQNTYANQDDKLTRVLKAVERMYEAEYRQDVDESVYDKERREAFVGVLRAWDEMLG